MANNNEYWEERQAKFWANLEKDESKIVKEINKTYDKEAIRLEKEIASFYTKYGKNDILEYQNLLKQLDREDADLLYRNYNEFAMKYPQYAKLQDVRNNIYKLNRLEGLNESIKLQQMNIAAEKTEKVKGFLGNVFTTASDDVVKATGRGFNGLNSQLLERTVNNKWVGGKNFSERIWEDREKVANYIQNDLREAIVRGDSIQNMQKKMRQRFNVSKSNAERLITTESAYVMNESQALSFVEMGYTEYKILSTLDSRTSKICREQDGKVYKYEDRQVGLNYPPFHARCRSTTLVVVDSDEIDGTRIARDHNGNNIKVPKDFTYGDYKKVMDTYKGIELAEPTVTKTLTETTNRNKGEMKGLEFKLKTLESLLRKVASDAKMGEVGKLTAIDGVNDILRYTSVAKDDDLVYNYRAMLNELKRKKYKHIQTKNTWSEGSVYKGINSVFETDAGQKFELQFHTSESFGLKNGVLHKLYEEYRESNTTIQRQLELANEMKRLSGTLDVPKNIDTIKNYKRRK